MASADYFLKIDGIEGESQKDAHKAEIELESFSWGVSNSGSMSHGGGGGAGKASFQDFHFVMQVNKATPKLMLACATGKHIPKATLVCRKAGGKQEEYLKVTFSDLLCSSYQAGGSNGSPTLMDQISLNFAKIEFEYKEQKPDGTLGGAIKAGYDQKTTKEV